MAADPSSIIERNCLRTLIMFQSPSSFQNDSFVRLTHLRILHLNGISSGSIPDSIINLIHVRLLILSFTEVSTLPESLGSITNLQILELRCFSRLQTLPKSITWLFNLRCLHIVRAPELRGVENLPFLSSQLAVFWSDRLEKISNLPALKRLRIIECPALRCVENLNALQCLELTDESMDSLPEWILGLLQERQHHHQDNLELILRCGVRLLARCLRGCLDWPIIQQFSRVNASTNTGEASLLYYLHYTKLPFSYQTNLESDGSNDE